MYQAKFVSRFVILASNRTVLAYGYDYDILVSNFRKFYLYPLTNRSTQIPQDSTQQCVDYVHCGPKLKSNTGASLELIGVEVRDAVHTVSLNECK